MSYILNYFWCIGIVLAAINAFVLKFRMPKTEVEEEIKEQKNVIIGYFLFFGIPCMLLQVFQVLGNYHSPLYPLYRDFSNTFYWLGVCSFFLCYIIGLCVVIKFKNIEKYTQMLFKAKLSRKSMILIMIGIIIWALIIIFCFPPMEIKDTMEHIA